MTCAENVSEGDNSCTVQCIHAYLQMRGTETGLGHVNDLETYVYGIP
jgi:hypothetical protein